MSTTTVTRKAIKTFKDLEVYGEGFRLAMDIFAVTKSFPKDEQYALTSQMRNASRSVPANIAEGWAKRRYEMIFKRQLLDALGSVNEMLVWLDTAQACRYLSDASHSSLTQSYEVLGRRLHQLLANWKTFT